MSFVSGTGWGMSINRKTGDLWAASFQDLSPSAFLGMGDPNAGFVTQFSSTPERSLLRIIKEPFIAGVQGMNSDENGNVFFACVTSSRVCRVDAEFGTVLCVNHTTIQNPFDVDVDSQGNVWVNDANTFTSPSYATKLSNNLDFILARELPPPTRDFILVTSIILFCFY